MNPNPTNILLWLIVSLLGASAVGGIALHRGESINALWFLSAALCIYAIAYRFYSAWIAATVLSIDPSRATPAERLSLIHISEPTRLGMISYAVFCLKKK